MKRSLVGLLVFIAVSLLALPLQAEEMEHSGRKGFVIGFDVGGGGVRFPSGSRAGAISGTFKIGGGLSERVLLLYEDGGVIGLKTGAPSTYYGLVSSQLFVIQDFYVRPGIGFAYGEVDTTAGTYSTDIGFAAGIAAGYEFRLTKRFALSPEVKVDYSRLEGGDYYHFGATLDLRWYF